jgi:4-amino-4-deoxy-L-arabinose transferase-like glycosyltransferase
MSPALRIKIIPRGVYLWPTAWLVLIVVAFCALSMGYNLSLPLFEGFDETAHYRVVDFYARHWALPDLNRPPSHEAHQPPLYYALGAVLIAPIERSNFDQVFQINPNSAVSVRQNRANPDEAWPPQGTALAVRLLRLFSTALGAATVLLTYALARQLHLPAGAACLAAALIAFNPKFIMLSASVGNDIAAACLAALCLTLSARLLSRAPTLLNTLSLGAALGLAVLSKSSNLALGLPVGVALLWALFAHGHTPSSPNRSRIAQVVACGLALIVGVVGVAGWYYLAQWRSYGSPLAWEQVSALNQFSLRETPLSSVQLAAMLPALFPTLWRVNSALPVQGIGDALSFLILGLALVGLLLGVARRRLPHTLWLLPVALAASVIALAPWMRLYQGTEDSRLLPTWFSGMAVLGAAGLMVFGSMGRVQRVRWLATPLIAAELLWALSVPRWLIVPSFIPFPPLPAADIIQQVAPAEVDQLPKAPVAIFENGVELAQVKLSNDRLSVHELAQVQLIWRIIRPVMRDYALSVEAFDPGGHSLGKLDTLPLEGRRSTRVWQVGDVYREVYTLTLNAVLTNTPTLVNLYVGWHAAEPPYRLVGMVGSPAVTAQIGQVKVRAAVASKAPQHAVDARLGDMIDLEGYDVDGEQLTLYWRARGRLSSDYQVFVHVLNAQGETIAQADGPLPLPYQLWENGERVLDRRIIPGLAEAPAVMTGLYERASGTRLMAQHENGRAWPDNRIELWKQGTP